jgi:hypothetical protein
MDVPNNSINKGAITTTKQKDIDVNRINRSYYLNLFSAAAEKTLNGSNNAIFKWNIRDLQLGSSAEIALVQLIHDATGVGSHTSTGYTFRILETYADGYDSYNQTSAIVYMGIGLATPAIPTYHKLISNNLNTITLVATGDNSAADKVYSGIDTGITFGMVLHILDYFDKDNSY